MSYIGPRHNVFIYHAHALALGGWVKAAGGRYVPLPSVAPSVLSIGGGFCSNSEKNVNVRVRGREPFGRGGPKEFYLYIGRAYTEVSGIGADDEKATGRYTTRVRSILDDLFINDDFYVEHAEAVLSSIHDKPGKSEDNPPEPDVIVGDSNMHNVQVRGLTVTLNPHRHKVDEVRTFGALMTKRAEHEKALAMAGKGGDDGDDLIADLCDWDDPDVEKEPYVHDVAAMNKRATKHLSYSLFKSVSVPENKKDVKAFHSSLEVQGFGRIFLGEVMASYGMKQVTMFRLDLGCDNCGDVGGSGGTTNGTTYPP